MRARLKKIEFNQFKSHRQIVSLTVFRAFHSAIYDVTESNRGVTVGVWCQKKILL